MKKIKAVTPEEVAGIRKDLYELPFDQFQRYKTVSDFVGFVREKSGSALKVLDVGGYPGLITDFLPDDDVTIVDVMPGMAPNYIQAGGEELPFEDNFFDLVCSCDTLEHVAGENRKTFLTELARVSKEFMLIAAPFSDPRTDLAEEILFSYALKVLKVELGVLKEHLDNGLPDLDQTLVMLNDSGIESDHFPSGYLYNWLPMMVAKHHLLAHEETAELHRRVDLFYNLNFSKDDYRQPSYRQVIIGSKSGDKKAEAFCRSRQVASEDVENSTTDLARLELFRMMSDLLDLNLKREVSELVEHFKNSTSEELTAARASIIERDNQVKDLKKIIEAQNDSLDELHALVTRVRNFWPYRVYTKLFKR